jgi:uncharacterized membrane protein YdjX (TVP38/TMEM64 family)
MTEEQAPSRVAVVDVQIPFWSMVGLLVKMALAAIPAIIILTVLAAVLFGLVSGIK